ncbi:hypothetical protein CERSUDRAFT_149450 [Gelatoporia subvermispora B]|uniref:Uncharacterized protein n=1 Tax=Ceriporiopsis subvermispora (strain B) TaxID=914234 RepID=M2RPX3_CERS8|nr:hypothetical protein CERSUDRAFT_149450 [Gelatoporia subvermispora B]
MSTDDHDFLFSPVNSKRLNSARKVHIRRLYDVFQLCLHRNDIPRAQKAWSILARCREVDWKTMWTTGVLLLGEHGSTEPNERRIEFLSAMLRQHPDERETILKELILRLIHSGMHRRALDELELYLPSLPYQDNPVLHVYAGLISMYLAQPQNHSPRPKTSSNENHWNSGLLRDAQAHFERARALDPSNTVASAFLEQVW